MTFIQFLSRWQAKAAVRAHVRRLQEPEARAKKRAQSRADSKAADPPEVPLDDSPPGHKIRWWC
jgi:hypothetical protein